MSNALRDAIVASPPNLATVAELVGMLGDKIVLMSAELAELRAQGWRGVWFPNGNVSAGQHRNHRRLFVLLQLQRDDTKAGLWR